MPAWRVRRATAADAPALSIIASATFLDTYAGVLDGGDLIAHCLKHNRAETFADWLTDDQTVVTLAELEPGYAPVGYTVLTRPDFPIDLHDDDIELRRIYTLSRTHGSGLGPALMAQAMADARHAGAARVLLGVWERNHRARAFYERQGFSVIGSRRFQVGSVLHDDPVYARAVGG